MAKILEFKRVKQEEAVERRTRIDHEPGDIEGYISAVINDYSLTVANRHWLLDNMLMDVDDQLEAYKKELEEAEKKLDALVKTAEREIAAAYSEFTAHVGGMTRAVKKLTTSSSRETASTTANAAPAKTPDKQTTPQ